MLKINKDFKPVGENEVDFDGNFIHVKEAIIEDNKLVVIYLDADGVEQRSETALKSIPVTSLEAADTDIDLCASYGSVDLYGNTDNDNRLWSEWNRKWAAYNASDFV